jgi:hypothetical protein
MAEARRDCPFCGTHFERVLDDGIGDLTTYQPGEAWDLEGNEAPAVFTGNQRSVHRWVVRGYVCPRCGEHSADLEHSVWPFHAKGQLGNRGDGTLEVLPLIPWGSELPVPAEVPEPIADDYREATRIMGLSLKGATTMARRCLQRVIREAYPAMPADDKRTLNREINWVIANSNWDQEVLDTLHHLREAGNFGAHPGEDGLTEIYELTEDDLEGCLTLLETLFQQVYVEPARRRERLANLRAQVPVRGRAAVAAPAAPALPAPSAPPASVPPASGSQTTT